MKYDNDIAPQMIKCPSCGTVQAAIVEFTLPWQTFIHECVKCKYTIMESEWHEINPYILNPMGIWEVTLKSLFELRLFLKKAHDHGFINGDHSHLISITASFEEFERLNHEIFI